MKSRIFLAASVFAVVACLGVAGMAQSGKQVPFKGSIQGHETHTPQTFPEITANGSCTGIGTLVMGDNHTSRATTIRIPDQRQ